MRAQRCSICNICSRKAHLLRASVVHHRLLNCRVMTRMMMTLIRNQSLTPLLRVTQRRLCVHNMRTAHLSPLQVHNLRLCLQSHPSPRRSKVRHPVPRPRARRLLRPDRAVAYVTGLQGHVRRQRHECQLTYKIHRHCPRPPRPRQRTRARATRPTTGTPWLLYTRLRVTKTTMLTRSLRSPSSSKKIGQLLPLRRDPSRPHHRH